MFMVTMPAGARLAHLLQSKSKQDDSVVRIIRRKKRLRLRMDHLRPNDQTVTHDGRVVLAVDQSMSASLTSHKLDVRETDAGPRLSLKSQ